MNELFKTFPYWMQLSIIIIPVISLMIAALAFLLNLRQTILNNTLVRAKMVSDSLHTFINDATIQTAFYKIEYNDFEYGDDFHGSDAEKEIDKLLRHFSNLALMWKNGLLRTEDIQPIQYYILRITRDDEVKKYFGFLDQWFGIANTGAHPYAALKDLSHKLDNNILQ